MIIAAAQTEVSFDKQRNIFVASREIRSAALQGADMVILPEMWNCPYTSSCFSDYAEEQSGISLSAISDVAAECGVYVVAGSIPERDGGKVYNTSFVFDRTGAIIANHRKVHLFDINVSGGQKFSESETFTAGDSSTVFDTEFGRLGLCICFDMRFPELARKMTLDGARALIVPAAFNMTTGPAHWELMFRQRAVDNQLFTIGVSPARDENGVYISYGNSIICSPWGEVLARAGHEAQTIIYGIDLDENESIRAQLPLLSARREQAY